MGKQTVKMLVLMAKIRVGSGSVLRKFSAAQHNFHVARTVPVEDDSRPGSECFYTTRFTFVV